MELEHRIAALESRVKALGLTLTDLCQETGVARATVSRWRNGHGSPSLRNYGQVFGKLETAVTAHELALRDHLVALHPLAAGGGAASEPAHPTPCPSPVLRQAQDEGGGEQVEREERAA